MTAGWKMGMHVTVSVHSQWGALIPHIKEQNALCVFLQCKEIYGCPAEFLPHLGKLFWSSVSTPHKGDSPLVSNSTLVSSTPEMCTIHNDSSHLLLHIIRLWAILCSVTERVSPTVYTWYYCCVVCSDSDQNMKILYQQWKMFEGKKNCQQFQVP